MEKNKKYLKYLIIGIFFLFGICFPSHGQIKQIDHGDSRLQEEIKKFITTVKIDCGNASKYLVFVLRGIESDSAGNYCITICYILNSFDYDWVDANFFFKVEEDFVIVSKNNRFEESVLNVFSLFEISDEARKTIFNKLSPGIEGGYTYTSKALVICNINNCFNTRFYGNSSQLPHDWSIHSNFPSGFIMKRLELREPGELLIPDEK